jgi:iron complex transport system ATP-binding protein
MVVFEAGGIVADGAPAAVLTPQLLARVFHVHAHVIPHPEDGSPVCLPYALADGAMPDAAWREAGTDLTPGPSPARRGEQER